MTRIAVSVDVDAPPERVWATVGDIERHAEWMADAERITFRTQRRQGIGTEFVCDTRVGRFTIQDVMTVVEWEPPHVMGVRHRGVVSGVGRFSLDPLPGGRTRFSWSETLHFPARVGGPLAGAVAKPVLAWVWRRNLTRLQALVEGT